MERLIENIKVKNSEIKPLSREKVQEAIEENDQILGGYKVPVWRLDVTNLNGRIYPYELGERIVSQNLITYALDGHDANEVYANVKAIGKNPSIEDGILYAECYFVDEDFYKKAVKIIEHGGDLGLSSVGYGELDREGKIVAESYQLERYFDFVFYPSYAVYMDKDSEVVQEDTENSTAVEEENNTAVLVSEDEMKLYQDIYEIKNKRRTI